MWKHDTESTLSRRLITSHHPRPPGLLINHRRMIIGPVRRVPVIIMHGSVRRFVWPRSTETSCTGPVSPSTRPCSIWHCACSGFIKEKQLIVPVNEKNTTFSTLQPFHRLVNLFLVTVQTCNYLNRYRDAVFPTGYWRNISKGFAGEENQKFQTELTLNKDPWLNAVLCSCQ